MPLFPRNPIKSNPGGSLVSLLVRQYYGVGRVTTSNLLRSIGISPAIKRADLPPHQLTRIHRILKQQVSPAAKQQKEANIVAKIRSNTVAGSRMVMGLPSHGQRTSSNARTAKKFKNYHLGLVRGAMEREG